MRSTNKYVIIPDKSIRKTIIPKKLTIIFELYSKINCILVLLHFNNYYLAIR